MPFRLKTVVSPFILTLVVLISSATCGRESEGYFSFAYVQEDCGPTDGPALHFYFTQKQSEAGKYKEPFLDILISGNPKSAPRDYSIRSGSAAVFASRCLTPGQCVGATSGTLHLTKFDERRGVSWGEYKLRFKDGSVEKGSFNATRYFVPVLCG
jgi:hypothetical protein